MQGHGLERQFTFERNEEQTKSLKQLPDFNLTQNMNLERTAALPNDMIKGLEIDQSKTLQSSKTLEIDQTVVELKID